MKIKKLNQKGFTHHLMLLAFVVMFAVAGVGYLVASHADSLHEAGATGKLRLTAGPSSGEVLYSGYARVPACHGYGHTEKVPVNKTVKCHTGRYVATFRSGHWSGCKTVTVKAGKTTKAFISLHEDHLYGCKLGPGAI